MSKSNSHLRNIAGRFAASNRGAFDLETDKKETEPKVPQSVPVSQPLLRIPPGHQAFHDLFKKTDH